MALDPEVFDALIDTIRRFVAERLRPLEAAVEEADAIPDEIVREMRELGLFGLSIAEEYGGLGLTMREECLVGLEMGRTTPAFRSTCPKAGPGRSTSRRSRSRWRSTAAAS